VIPRASITAWRKAAPRPDNTQVEQDLVLSRALVELFRRPALAERAVFRGGTALHKLFFERSTAAGPPASCGSGRTSL
jgi:predicted nucleotidyltransferase component of viral defense system